MMKILRPLTVVAALCGGLLASSWATAVLPPPPPPPPAYAAPGSVDMPRDARDSRDDASREAYPEVRRGNWRNLSPEQRDAIRRLSQEERQALIHRAPNRPGEAPVPAARLSREERLQLRAQIREEHERRGPRAGGGKRP
jgi:hypothetical protein